LPRHWVGLSLFKGWYPPRNASREERPTPGGNEFVRNMTYTFEGANKASINREAMREVLGSELVRELKLK
jgi:hypothetical protein